MGVNDLVQLAELNQMVQADRREALMRSGVSLVDPSTVFINGPTIDIGSDTVIEPQVTLNSPVIIGHNVTIGFGSHLTDANIGDNTVIKPYTVVESASIGSQAQVGPFARLRPGTTLSDAAHVGNFCELKTPRWAKDQKLITSLTLVMRRWAGTLILVRGPLLVIMTAQVRTKRPSVMMSLLDRIRALSRQ